MRLDVRNTRSIDGEHRWKTLDQYSQTYWSGLDAQIFANDVFLDELVSLQWRLDEAVAPLFGYADYVYSTVMHGARRIQGSFMLNFKREGYLYELLSKLARPKKAGDTGLPNFRRGQAFAAAMAGDATLEHFVALAAGAGSTIKGSTAGNGTAVDQSLLSRVADDFTAALWGDAPRDPSSRLRTVTTNLVGHTGAKKARFELAHRFDLNISFGRPPGGDDATRRQAVGTLGYEPDTLPTLPVNTALKLTGVALTSREMILDDSGRPILESYTFIARDVL